MKIDGGNEGHGASRVQRSLSFGVQPDVLLDAWCDPDVQAQLFKQVADQLPSDEEAMRWRVQLPLERRVDVQSRRIEFVEGARARHAANVVERPDVQVTTDFSVRRAPADFGTEATLLVEYALPGGVLGDAAVKLFGSAPDLLAGGVLRRLKALLETGEVPTLERNPSARDAREET